MIITSYIHTIIMANFIKPPHTVFNTRKYGFVDNAPVNLDLILTISKEEIYHREYISIEKNVEAELVGYSIKFISDSGQSVEWRFKTKKVRDIEYEKILE